MNAILISRNGYPSMKMVYNKLRDADVPVALLRRRSGEWDIAPTEPIDTLIRWGSIARSGGSDITYNKAKAISLASNKAAARFALQEAGVPVPRTVWYRDLVGVVGLTYPVVVRPQRHQGGAMFFLCENTNEVAEAAKQIWQLFPDDRPYVSEFYPKQNEYRVHVLCGQVLFVNEKVPREGQEGKRSEPIWNHHINDFYFQVLRWRDWPLEVVRAAIAATKAVGLDFAGVDVMANAPNREPVAVCELNTAPSVNEDYSSTKYAAAFKYLLDEKREWLDLSYQAATDYAFRGEL